MGIHYEIPLSPEQEYEAAGWVCVVETLKDLGERRKRDELDSNTKRWVGAYGFLLARICNHDPSGLVAELESQTNSSIRHAPTMLTNSQMISPEGVIHPGLGMAHELSFARNVQPDQRDARERFSRLETHILNMREYNRSVLAKVCARSCDYTIGHALKEVRRESAFFVGYYDNED